MLGDTNVHAVLGVKDLDAAKKFYGGTLGLTQIKEDFTGVLYKSGNSSVFVYQTEFGGTNQATAASWEVDVNDLDAVVADLKGKGVVFERYDNIPGVTMEGDLHVMGSKRGVWFKDPSGNILCVSNGAM